MAAGTARLYPLCFTHQSFREINDNLIEAFINLIEAFIHLVDGYEQDAKLAAKEAVYPAKTAAVANLKAAGRVLNLFVDPSIPTHASFGSVQEKAFTLLLREQFPSVTHYMSDAEFDEAGFEWAYYVRMSYASKVNLRHLFSELDFAGRVEDAPLLKAVSFLLLSVYHLALRAKCTFSPQPARSRVGKPHTARQKVRENPIKLQYDPRLSMGIRTLSARLS